MCVCAYGVLIKEPLLSAYEILNVHPSLLPRWRGAAPVERAIMAGDEETGVSIMRLTEGLDSGPVCLQEREPIRPDDDYATLSDRLRALGGDLLLRALDERPPFAEQDEAGVTYAHKIEARDRALDHTRPPEEVERDVRALRPHIGARLPLPDGSFLGVFAARVDGETLAPAGGRVRTDGERLLLDCNGGALELLEVQPPGNRPMAAADWLRGRPDPALVNFWLDPRLPRRSLEELTKLAISEWRSDAEWAPYLAALAWRGDETVLDAARELSQQDDPRARAAAAYVLGQLGLPERTFPADSAAALEALEAREEDPDVLATIASAFGHLGSPHGTETLLRLRRHDDRARPRGRDGRAGGARRGGRLRRARRAHGRSRGRDPRLGHVRARHPVPAQHARCCATRSQRAWTTRTTTRASRRCTGSRCAATRARSTRCSTCSARSARTTTAATPPTRSGSATRSRRPPCASRP